MSTPRKTPTDSGDTEVSEIRTPFRERALEEQRLKDEILIRSTPGYKKLLSTSAQPHDILNKDPNELRSFLQDLSQVLARKSQGGDTNANESRARNLIDELTYEENRIEETEFLQSGSSKDADKNIDDETQAAGYTSLSQTVFAQLHERDKGLKSRKVDPIVIQDAPMAEEEDSVVSSSKSADNVSMDVLETLPGRGRDVADESSIHGSDSILIMEQEEEASEPLTMDREGEEEEEEEEEEEKEKEHSQADENSEVLGDMRNDPVHLNIPVARHAPVRPLQIADLKHLTRQFLNENEIILPKQTWLTIQEESLHIMNFLDKKIGTLQKQSLVDSFIDMGIIHDVDDMFELVHELLPLEHQSRIETYLF